MARATRRKPIDPSRLLTTAEVMERYQFSRRTLDRLVAAGEVTIVKRRPSRKRYWNPDELDGLWEEVG
jgi:predicted DNA-binding transcriptional regulator AlpA